MNTGKILQKCRWERGLSQEKLSKISGIPRQTIGSIELNKHSTSVAIFKTLLGAMGYSLVIVDAKANNEKQKRGNTEAIIGKALR